ncbi:hypothetical protein PRUPE_8G059000 [Prunus persica]|uniref:Uncharacterized protein n=1 Tax=Prunus persica TaxID=3760 RepID=A0A251MTV6_PRUPE|nr:hypothetical protein PRUPE_8G059000 [Prunus persica]
MATILAQTILPPRPPSTTPTQIFLLPQTQDHPLPYHRFPSQQPTISLTLKFLLYTPNHHSQPLISPTQNNNSPSPAQPFQCSLSLCKHVQFFLLDLLYLPKTSTASTTNKTKHHPNPRLKSHQPVATPFSARFEPYQHRNPNLDQHHPLSLSISNQSPRPT